MLRSPRPWRARVIALAFALGSSCADPEQLQFENRRHRELEAFEFQRPIEQVWPELVQALAEDGFTLAEKTPVEDRTLETSLQGVDYGYRVLVRVIRLDETRFRIQLQRQYQHHDGTKSLEGWNTTGNKVDELAWTLIQRTEPARAAAIQDALLGRTSAAGCSR